MVRVSLLWVGPTPPPTGPLRSVSKTPTGCRRAMVGARDRCHTQQSSENGLTVTSFCTLVWCILRCNLISNGLTYHKPLRIQQPWRESSTDSGIKWESQISNEYKITLGSYITFNYFRETTTVLAMTYCKFLNGIEELFFLQSFVFLLNPSPSKKKNILLRMVTDTFMVNLPRCWKLNICTQKITTKKQNIHINFIFKLIWTCFITYSTLPLAKLTNVRHMLRPDFRHQ